jgi:hypothetical protein
MPAGRNDTITLLAIWVGAIKALSPDGALLAPPAAKADSGHKHHMQASKEKLNCDVRDVFAILALIKQKT